MYDYYYGKMAYSTGQINDFKLTYIKSNGFVLSIPDIVNPECTLDYTHHEKVFNKFEEYTNWGHILGIENAADLNKAVSRAKVCELVNLAEAHYDSQLAKIAEDISNSKKDIKVVLIAGPSSAGKTTTSKKLDISSDNIPLSILSLIAKFFKLRKFTNSSGIVPISLLLFRAKVSMFVNFDISHGISPSN